jgi:hypothetical protein
MSPRLEGDLPPQAPLASGMSARVALRAEYTIIGIGVFALALIFQPFSLRLFGFGCGLVVLAGLINNLLPLCRPGVAPITLVRAGLIVAFIFCVLMLVSLTAAYLYGVFFVTALSPDDSVPFYRQPFVWGIAVVAAVLAVAITLVRSPNRTAR